MRLLPWAFGLPTVAGMTLTDVDDLPEATMEVMRRRASAAGVPLRAHLRAELIALADRRVPVDSVVEFLATERPDHRRPELDSDAAAAIHAYDLPAPVWSVLADRAAATGLPLADYVRQELIVSARRRTIDDALLEFDEVLGGDAHPAVNRDVLVASIRYARGE